MGHNCDEVLHTTWAAGVARHTADVPAASLGLGLAVNRLRAHPCCAGSSLTRTGTAALDSEEFPHLVAELKGISGL